MAAQAQEAARDNPPQLDGHTDTDQHEQKDMDEQERKEVDPTTPAKMEISNDTQNPANTHIDDTNQLGEHSNSDRHEQQAADGQVPQITPKTHKHEANSDTDPDDHETMYI